MLASDSDVQHLTMAIDGSLYCYAKVSSDNVLFKSNDDGRSWDTPDKTPSSDGPTYVVMADDFADSGKAYATTSGAGSAFSITQLVTMLYPALPGSVI